MYLSKLKIWNFRKYGKPDMSNEGAPALTVPFHQGLNLIVGENDGGKTAVIDSIKLVLGTKSHDFIKVEEKDFYVNESGNRSDKIKIECTFNDLSDLEAGQFIEWLTFNGYGENELIIRLTAKLTTKKILVYLAAGEENLDTRFDARELLRVTYLKPLRDAEQELSSGYHSRFAQVLINHPIFRNAGSASHPLEKYFSVANEKVKQYFEKYTLDKDDVFKIEDDEIGAREITKFINDTLEGFMGINYEDNHYNAYVDIARNELAYILRKLSLNIDEKKVGLGSLNQLFMALELLLFETEKESYNLALIEELEAHLHPQAQLRLIKYLQDKNECDGNEQFIITTHSITLASKVNVQNMILLKNNLAYPMGCEYTKLNQGDYQFLHRFLDATKANLFFAKGIIFVEGDAENLLVPIIAEIIGLPLYRYGVSVVNVGNTAFLRYTKLFVRINNESIYNLPISVMSDLDVKPDLDELGDQESREIYFYKTEMLDSIQSLFSDKKINLNCLHDTQFLSMDEVYEVVKRANQLKDFHGIRGLKEKLNEFRTPKKSIDELRQLTKEKKKKKYDNGAIKLFTNLWTLEYDLALCEGIRVYLYCAISIAKKIGRDESVIEDIQIEQEIDTAKASIEQLVREGKNTEQIAYHIYEALYKKEASKAVAAQYFGQILLKNKESLRISIENDPHCKYIVDAIKHVCKKDV